MTDVLSTAARPKSGPDEDPDADRRQSERAVNGLYTAVVVAVGAAVVGIVVIAAIVLLAWAFDSGGSISALTAVRAAGQAWLLAHHSPLGTASGTIGLVPMGLVALPAALLGRAGILLGRANRPAGLLEAARLTLAVAATYERLGG